MDQSNRSISVGTVDLKPNFLPWIGSEYENRERARSQLPHADGANWFVHAMGESHYRGDYSIDESLTRRVVNDWAFASGRGSRFFRGVIQAVKGLDYKDVDPATGWADIAYSNYVQEPLDGPRLAPTSSQWADAGRKFFGQLAITRPRVLLVLGRRLWDNFPFGEENRLPPLLLPDPENPVTDAWAYPYLADGKPSFTIAVWSYHPSSSKFDWREAHRRVTAADMHWDNLSISIFEELGW